ncbi:MAG: hypothetical protein WCL14_06700 [Bacteroidota bacterium]
MKKNLSSYVKTLLAFSGIIACVSYTLSISVFKDNFPISFWFLLLFFVLITYLFHYGLLKSSHGDPKLFFRFYMAATGIKLFVFMTFIFVYGLIFRNEAVPLIVSFLALYFLFTIFETIVSQKTFRK